MQRLIRTIPTLVLLSLVPLAANATTIRTFSLMDLLQFSGAMIEGTVVQATPAAGDATTVPWTTFRVCGVKFHKGAGKESGGCIDIPTTGADASDGSSAVDGPSPRVGSHIIAFLDSAPTYISPFLGWWQGIFFVKGTQDCVYAAGDRPVTGLDSNSVVQSYVPQELAVAWVPGFPGDQIGATSPARKPTPQPQCVTRQIFLDTVLTARSMMAGAGIQMSELLPPNWGPGLSRSVPAEMPKIQK